MRARLDPLETLAGLTVGDVMNRTVVTLAASQTMPQAARELREHDVSCAPVLDSAGRCVGVLSATDFVRREAALAGPRCSPLETAPVELIQTPRGEWSLTSDLDTVEHHMSRGVQTIAARRSVLSAARVMCDGHLHRLVVLDSAERPVGMISTMDVISALLNTLDEASLRELNAAHSLPGSDLH